MRIFVVRHGATDFEDFTLGPQDLNLNGCGQAQALLAALTLKELISNPAKVALFTSPLLRALDTALEIAKALGIEISGIKKELEEYYYGDYRTVEDINDIPADAESKEDFFKRVLKIFSILLLMCKANPLIEDVIIVTHKHVFECIVDAYTKPSEKIDSIKLPKGHPPPLITIEKGEIALLTMLDDFSLKLEMVKSLSKDEKERKTSRALQRFRKASSSIKIMMEQRQRKKISIPELRALYSDEMEFFKKMTQQQLSIIHKMQDTTEQQLSIINKMQETMAQQAIEIEKLRKENKQLLSTLLPSYSNNSNILFCNPQEKMDSASAEKEDKGKDLISCAALKGN